MANTKISALTSGNPAQAGDLIPIDRAGANFAVTAASVANQIATIPSAAAATTQTPFNNSTAVATTAYVDANFKGPGITGFREDFIANPESASVISTGTTVVFDTCWQAHQLLVNGTLTGISGTFTNPGICQMTTGATGTGDGLTLHKDQATIGPLGILGGNAGWEIDLVFQLVQITACALRIGVSDGSSLTDPPNNGMWVEFDTANTGNTDADFTLVTRSSSVSAYTKSTVAADTNFHSVKIFSTVAGTISMTVDGGSVLTTTTDVSISVMEPFIQVLTRTAGAKSLNMDFYSYTAKTGRTI